MTQNHRRILKEIGSKLEDPPHSKDALVKLLKQAASCLSEIDQSPSKSLLGIVQLCANAIARPEFLKHQDRDVKLLVSACICETMRITAPEPPYIDDVLRDAFHLIVGIFSSLDEMSSPSFGRKVAILETLAKYRSCVVMLDLACNDLVSEMFNIFLSVVSNDHPEAVLISMQTIMILLVDESEDVQEELLLVLLSALGQHENDVSLAGQRLAVNVIEQCAGKLEPYINQFLISAISRNAHSPSSHFDHHEIIYNIYHRAPQFLRGVTPYLLEELLADEPDIRLKSVNLLGRMFALPGRTISEVFQPLFSEFLKRLTDRVVNIRTSVVGHMKACLLSNLSRPETAQIISALSDRLLDYDESVRKQVVAAMCDVAEHNLEFAPIETIKFVAERLRDKSITVKRYTLERLVELYRLQCLKSSDGSIDHNDYKWLPGKILRCFYDKDLRYEAMDKFLFDALIPAQISVKDKVKNWIAAFSEFEKVETKALEQALLHKQRLQKEMQRYLALRKKYQDKNATDTLKKTFGCMRAMARSFNDPAKAEENFKVLDQMKDVNVWKILASLPDASTSTIQALTVRDDLLKILGDRHPLFDFLGTLTAKCSFILFNKEHIKEILDQLLLHKSARNEKLISSCLDLLVILASFFSPIFKGVEEQLVLLLKDDNETIKEGILHVFAKAGGAIRDQLLVLASSVDLLDRLCLEGTRKQAKYAVQALSVIKISDGPKSLSPLYKHLVDMLEKRMHLPAILQSLGYIAQTAMPIFETREEEIVGFISSKILPCSVVENISSTDWDKRSKQCLLKIFAIKTLVKSYLPIKGAHLRTGIENFVGVLKCILSFGEVSQNVESSVVDKAHLRLASAKAILRLSRIWDHKIPNDVFRLTLKISQDIYPQVRKHFLAKVHQYAKDRVVDPKYAISLPLGMHGILEHEYKEYRHHLVEIVEMLYREAKSRKLYASSGQNLLSDCPEYIFVYFIHALAHDNSFPNIDELPDAEAFVPIFWRLHTFLSVFGRQDVEGKSETGFSEVHDRVCAIISIFESIKHSEDVIDSTKSKNSHITCEIGLMIMKHLCNNQQDAEFGQSIPLPSLLYRKVDKSEYDVNGEYKLSWLAGDDLFAHLHSLSLQVDSIPIKDEKIFESGEKDGIELPLMKMMKLLKSKKSKKNKIVMHTSEKIKRQEAEQAILSQIKEFDKESLDRDVGLAVHELATEYLEQEEMIDSSSSRKMTDKGTYSHGSNCKRKVSVRDVSTMSNSLKTTKKNKKDLGVKFKAVIVSTSDSLDTDRNSNHLEHEVAINKMKVEPTSTIKLLEPAMHTKKKDLSRRKKGHNFTLKDDMDTDGNTNHEEEENSSLFDEKFSSFRGSQRSTKKSKSVSGLEKCSMVEASKDNLELVGCRIKVWWPMDKRFYVGTVQSFDSEKMKHLILYDDGDVETLKLDKEKWERIDDSHLSEQSPLPSRSTFQRKSSGNRTVEKDHNISAWKRNTARRKENQGNSLRLSHKSSKNRVSLPSHEGGSGYAAHPNSEDSVKDEHIASSEILSDEDNRFEDPMDVKEGGIFKEESRPGPSDRRSVKDSDDEQKGCSGNSDDEPLGAWKLRPSKGD